jgi:hypothetical protein
MRQSGHEMAQKRVKNRNFRRQVRIRATGRLAVGSESFAGPSGMRMSGSPLIRAPSDGAMDGEEKYLCHHSTEIDRIHFWLAFSWHTALRYSGCI